MEHERNKETIGMYINRLREKKGYTLEQISDGLCTVQLLFQLEKGEKDVSKRLQDAIFERLGVGAEDYEHYLQYREYEQWEMRQRILYRISSEEVTGAKALLKEYYGRYGNKYYGSKAVGDRLERQFYLGMWAQIRSMEGADREEMYSILEEAVQLTIFDLWKKPLDGRVFSLKEWNLILEAEFYQKGGGKEAHYKEILSCIERADMDEVGMAKTYPKAVYFLCKCVPETDETVEWLFRYCCQAVEILRDACRMYYLWELLTYRGHYLERKIRKAELRGECVRPFEEMYQENTDWKQCLEAVYKEYGVAKETFCYCYLYLEKGVFCISDVIRIRRQMLGMSRKTLCEGICDIRTLQRLENRQRITQRVIVEALFERLGLPGEMRRTELITGRPEVRQMMEKLRDYGNERETVKWQMFLDRIKKLVSTEIPCNRQVLMRKEINLQRARKEIEGEPYCARMQAILEITLPFQAFLREGEKFLTYEEQACIQNMMQEMDKESNVFFLCMNRFEEMYHSVADGELLGTVSGIYGLIMGYVGSALGNRGEYDRADWYGTARMKEELRSRRLVSIAICLYERLWNYKERKRRGIIQDRILDEEEELKKCILCSKLGRRTHNESFFISKLEQVKERRK